MQTQPPPGHQPDADPAAGAAEHAATPASAGPIPPAPGLAGQAGTPGPSNEPGPAQADENGSGLGFMVRALRYRNYRLYFGGQSISLTGTWMTRVAMSWLVYRLSGSALLLGVVGFAGQFPSFVLAPVAGVLVDRWDRHRLLVVTQVLAAFVSLALAALALGGVIQIWHIVVLSFFQGLINSFDMPARQAFVVELVERREDLPNAIALNSSMVNAARLLGPSIGGVLIAAVGEGMCFLIDGISYVAVITSLLLIKVAARVRKAPSKESTLHQLREGFSYAYGFAPIRSILLLLALVSLVGMPYTVLMPIFASKILHGGPNTLGWLMSISGIGALCGAVFLASRRSVLGLGKLIPLTAMLFGAGLIGFALSRNLILSLAMMLVTGFGFMVQMASSNTVLQTIVDDDKRGRVMGLFMMAFMGTAPLGSLLAGVLADRIGAPATLAAGGVCCIAAGLWFATQLTDLRRLVRPIYMRLGILSAVSASSELSVPPSSS